MLHEDSFFVRSVLRGMATYARPARPWLIERIPPEGFGRGRRVHLDCDGLITHIHQPALIASLRTLSCPVVGISHIVPDDPFPRVSVDNHAIGRLAAEHLLEHGHRSFAFVGIRHMAFSQERLSGLQSALNSADGTPRCRDIAPQWLQRSPLAEARGMKGLIEWLGALPRPTGLFACNDAVAWFISEVCRQVGIEIPIHLAILGVDNDDLICRMAYPPLSSIMLPGEQVGYRAAEQLDRAITEQTEIQSLLLPPIGVQTRQSSEFFAMDDPEMAAALRFIHDHATAGVTVGDVLREVPLARRALERRFNRLLGRTPLEEIHRVRVDAACQMLRTTTLPIEQIARQCGFGRATYLSRLLRRYRGQTPRQVRSEVSVVV